MSVHQGRDSRSSSLPRLPDALPNSTETLQGQDHDREVDGGEKGKPRGPPQPVGFWDEGLKKTRHEVWRRWLLMTAIIAGFVMAVLSMFWAVLFHVEQNISSLQIYVVDFDGQIAPYTSVTPLVGPLIRGMTEEIQGSPDPHLGYVTMSPSDFDNDPIQVRQAVFDQKAWAAIVINANATALLQQAVQQGNVSYDPLGACQVTYVEARDQDTYSAYILPQLNSLQNEITSAFGSMWLERILHNGTISVTTLRQAPQALNPAIGFSQYNLRPFAPAVMTPAVTIGLIYLIIISFFSFGFYMPIHMKLIIPAGHAPLKFWQFIVWRWGATMVAYGLLSLAYSLISLAFQAPFANPSVPGTVVAENPNAYGRGTFVVYWMINYVGMIALGLACENVAMIVGQPWTAMWLIFWVITNVATSFYSLQLSPRFYYWGYAWPLHNVVEASRTTLFDLHSRIGLNFGVLIAWCAVNTALFPLCCHFLRWKTQRERKKAAAAKN
ncbi:hypothetical protein MMC07_007554 [Pseudocyphellaria aurata]|nr:hypothetical protein [Pseudocyphellaria aurata]